MLHQINALLEGAIKELYPDFDDYFKIHFSSKEADYATNFAIKIKNCSGTDLTTKEIAEQVIAIIPENDIIDSFIVPEKGQVQIFVKPQYVVSKVDDIVLGLVAPSCEKQKIVVDFSSPNIAKKMHVGHLRSTIIGDTLCRILEFLGHDVIRMNHIGDWGTQFGMLIAHLTDKHPDFLNEEVDLGDIQEFYKEANNRFKKEDGFRDKALQMTALLQSGDEQITQAWQIIRQISLNECQKIYDRLGIQLETKGESFYQPYMVDLVTELQGNGLLEEMDGRMIVQIPDEIVPLTIVKSDGGFTYDTSDLAALKYRIFVNQADWIIYVVDTGQGLHFRELFKAGEMCGWLNEDTRLDHVNFGTIQGKDKKRMKSRDNETLPLEILLDTALAKSDKILRKKIEEAEDGDFRKELDEDEIQKIAEAVAYNSVKYCDLTSIRTKNYVFSYDKMLQMKGNTASRLMYSHIRIKGIVREANVPMQAIVDAELELAEPEEITLAKELARFQDIIIIISRDLCPHHLCKYLYNLSNVFNDFYYKHRIIDYDEINMSRLKLCQATCLIMEKGFDLLGFRELERM